MGSSVAVHSLNPPDTQRGGSAALELASRLVIGIAIAVHSGATPSMDIRRLHLFQTALPTFLSTAHPGYIYRQAFNIQMHSSAARAHVYAPVSRVHMCLLCYRLYVAFDTKDKVYNSTSARNSMEALFKQSVSAADANLWHPPGYQHGVSVDPSSLLISLHWVSQC